MKEIPSDLRQKIVTDDAVRKLAFKLNPPGWGRFKQTPASYKPDHMVRRYLEEELLPLLDFSVLTSDD